MLTCPICQREVKVERSLTDPSKPPGRYVYLVIKCDACRTHPNPHIRRVAQVAEAFVLTSIDATLDNPNYEAEKPHVDKITALWGTQEVERVVLRLQSDLDKTLVYVDSTKSKGMKRYDSTD